MAGETEQVKGHTKEAVGSVTGNKDLEAEGKADRTSWRGQGEGWPCEGQSRRGGREGGAQGRRSDRQRQGRCASRLLIQSERGSDVMSEEPRASNGGSTAEPAEVPNGPELTTPAPGSATGRTRISGVWVGVIVGVVVLVFLLVFIIQNGQSVKVSFFTGSVQCRSASLCSLQSSVAYCWPGSWRHYASGSSDTA